MVQGCYTASQIGVLSDTPHEMERGQQSHDYASSTKSAQFNCRSATYQQVSFVTAPLISSPSLLYLSPPRRWTAWLADLWPGSELNFDLTSNTERWKHVARFLLLNTENEVQVDLPSSTHYINSWVWFSRKNQASNSQIYNSVVLKGLYILTRNDVISYFALMTLLHAADFTVTIWFSFIMKQQ